MPREWPWLGRGFDARLPTLETALTRKLLQPFDDEASRRDMSRPNPTRWYPTSVTSTPATALLTSNPICTALKTMVVLLKPVKRATLTTLNARTKKNQNVPESGESVRLYRD